MKKRIVCLMATCLLGVSLLAGCGSSNDTTGADTSSQDQTSEDTGNTTIDKLNVAFVPSKDPDEIITATEPLKDMLKTELSKEGYDVGEVDITVGTSYEAVGEALSAGTADVGLIPGGTYVLYDDGCDVLLTATRDGLNKDSDNAKDWNDGKPTEKTADQEVYNYESKDGDTISIGVINTNQNSISDLFPDYKSKGMTSDTIDGKEGYVAWDYQPAMGFYYVENDKLVVLAVPYYCEETNQDYKELMEEIII